EVSAGWVDKAAARVNAQLQKAGFDEAMLAALAGQDVLAADETPVNVLDGSAPAAAPEEDEPDPEEKDGKAAAGAAHVLVIPIPRDAHAAVGEARARGGTALDQQVLDDLLERYDTAAAFGRTHNRLRDWDTGNHPGYALGCWLEQYREQVFLFARNFAVSWTNNVSERGAKAAKRHQAVSGYWHSLATLARWCRLRSYLDSAAAHGITALDAIAS